MRFSTAWGGSPWAGVQTQYCQNIDPGFSCAGQLTAQFITNPTRQLKGTWVDPSPVPADILATGLVENATDDPIEAEAIKAAQHFGYNVNATYLILTEPGHMATAYGTVYCAYHAETRHTTGHGCALRLHPVCARARRRLRRKLGQSGQCLGQRLSRRLQHRRRARVCRGGHRPGQLHEHPGWLERRHDSENGDKCAWKGLQNITLGARQFAVQPMWSNEANGGQGACAVTR